MIGKYDIYVHAIVNSMYRIGCLYKRGSCQQCFGSIFIVQEFVSRFSVNLDTKMAKWTKNFIFVDKKRMEGNFFLGLYDKF
jgi:hypothetical protein